MKLILITGPDGSGKSTLIDNLEKNSNSKNIAFLRVPIIDEDLFKSNNKLYEIVCFVNLLHKQADLQKIPQLKVIAMFSSMLIFKQLVLELQKNKPKYIFCERHPLIDTAVYAKSYSGSKMNPENVLEKVFLELNDKYYDEFLFLLSLLKLEVTTTNLSRLFLNYIYNKFNENSIMSIVDLEQIFEMKLPNKIYFLDAKTEVLMQRLKIRQLKESKNLEVHETKESIEKMSPVYKQVLKSINTEIVNVDANSFKNLDIIFKQLNDELL